MNNDQPPPTVEGRAQFYRVNEKTIRRWAERGAPLHSVSEMAQWMLTADKLPIPFRNRMRELVGNVEAGPDPDWETYKRERSAQKGGAQVNDLESFRDFYAKKLDAAIGQQSETKIQFYNGLLLDTTNAIRQQKLAEDKLGIEEGKLYTKDQLKKIIRAWTFWAMRGVDTDLPDLCKNVVGVKGVDEARRIVEPILLSARFLKPFAKASRIDGESELSPWIVAEMKDAVDDYLEDGAKAFDAAS